MALLVPDDLWAAIEPLLPRERPKPWGGRPRTPDRAALAGILFVLHTGIQWHELPAELGCCGNTCWRRLGGHRLLRTRRAADPEQYAENLEWERVHRAFHQTLLSLCGSRFLRAFCEQLADQLYSYRQLSVQKVCPTRDINAEHRTILDAVLANDADRASVALLAHYRMTADIVLADFQP